VNVLFVCVANAGRSVLAERIFRARAGDSDLARSAGSDPAAAAHPVVLAALAELGIDASDHVPQRLEPPLVAWADVVVATCDDACPVVPGKRYVQWRLPDPKGRPLGEVRVIRDEVATRVDALLAELGETEREQIGHLGE
jgi:arsenate reductase (thioredoxin)